MNKQKSTQNFDEARLYGYAPSTWEGVAESDRALLRKIKPAPRSAYKVSLFINRIEQWIKEETKTAAKMGGVFDLNPDFQRGHVWDEAKQVAYVESYLRGNASALFRFNNVSITGSPRIDDGDVKTYDMVCIDGLQRITALREFMADRLTVFEDLKASNLRGTVMDPLRTVFNFEVEVFAFPRRHELLDYYVAINAGGVVHTPEEIERVKILSQAAKASPDVPAAKGKRRSAKP